jgi:hypothetical protein
LNGENDDQPLDFVSFPSISRQTQYSRYIYNVYIYSVCVCIYILYLPQKPTEDHISLTFTVFS